MLVLLRQCLEHHGAALCAPDVRALAAAARLVVAAQGACTPAAHVLVAAQLCGTALARATLAPPPLPPLASAPRTGLLDIGAAALARALGRFWAAQYRALDLAAATAPGAAAAAAGGAAAGGLARWHDAGARIARWLAGEVAEQPTPRRQGAALRAVLAAMAACRRAADFQALRTAADALGRPAVLAARDAWAALSARRVAAAAALVRCVADDDGVAAAYRAALDDALAAPAAGAGAPVPVPLLAVHLRDIAALDTLPARGNHKHALLGNVLGVLTDLQRAHIAAASTDDDSDDDDDAEATALVQAASVCTVPPDGSSGSGGCTRALLDMLNGLAAARHAK